MADPMSAAGGVKVAGLIGAAIGSAVAVSYLPSLNVWQRWTAFATGVAAGYYGQEIAVYLLGWPSPLVGPAAFVLGLGGMGLCGAIFHAAKDPLGAWRSFRNIQQGREDK